ncbi:MAG: hypothetical protein ACLSFW_06935 [Bacteroides cellulosilyticus]
MSGYSQVLSQNVQTDNLPIDHPAITFKDTGLLYKQCRDYLSTLGVQEQVVKKAFDHALKAHKTLLKRAYRL